MYLKCYINEFIGNLRGGNKLNFNIKKLGSIVLLIGVLSSCLIEGQNVEASTVNNNVNYYTDGAYYAYNSKHHKILTDAQGVQKEYLNLNNKIGVKKISAGWYRTKKKIYYPEIYRSHGKWNAHEVKGYLYVKKKDVIQRKTYEQAEKDLNKKLDYMLTHATVKKVRVYVDYNQAWETQWQYTFKNNLGVSVDWFQLAWDEVNQNGNVVSDNCSETADNIKENVVFRQNVRLAFPPESKGFKHLKLNASAPKFFDKEMKAKHVK